MLAAVIPSVLTSAGSLLAAGHTPVTLAAGERRARERGEEEERMNWRSVCDSIWVYLIATESYSKHLLLRCSMSFIWPGIHAVLLCDVTVSSLLSAAVALGSSVGSYAGAEFALYLSEAQLRQLYMASLVVLGGRSLVGAVGNVHRLSRGYFTKKML